MTTLIRPTNAAALARRRPGVKGAAILLVGALWSLRRNRQAAAASVVVVALATTVMTAWAVTIMLDGNVADWDGVPAAGMDAIFDTTANDRGEDIAAAFITADAENVYFRMDQVNLAPCGSIAQPCCFNSGGPFCLAMGVCLGAPTAPGGTCSILPP
jgi:hypothetical protein